MAGHETLESDSGLSTFVSRPERPHGGGRRIGRLRFSGPFRNHRSSRRIKRTITEQPLHELLTSLE